MMKKYWWAFVGVAVLVAVIIAVVVIKKKKAADESPTNAAVGVNGADIAKELGRRNKLFARARRYKGLA